MTEPSRPEPRRPQRPSTSSPGADDVLRLIRGISGAATDDTVTSTLKSLATRIGVLDSGVLPAEAARLALLARVTTLAADADVADLERLVQLQRVLTEPAAEAPSA